MKSLLRLGCRIKIIDKYCRIVQNVSWNLPSKFSKALSQKCLTKSAIMWKLYENFHIFHFLKKNSFRFKLGKPKTRTYSKLWQKIGYGKTSLHINHHNSIYFIHYDCGLPLRTRNFSLSQCFKMPDLVRQSGSLWSVAVL